MKKQQLTRKNLLERIKLLEEENKKLKKLILIDELTTLYNRKGFWELGPSFFNNKPNNINDKRKEKIKKAALLFIDIDDFKKYNDHYGHDKGDKILKEFALYLKNKFRRVDLVVRWGGEEFLIILNNISFRQALKKAKKLLLDIQTHKFAKVNLTVSIGIIDISKEFNIKEAIKKADKLMYQAKKKGKNTICY
ncbi:MAG: GGDEF domain-containing protein [Minisyncoccia bacterium]